MEESIGMITAMNEITQNAGKTGNALKTISSNMAGVSTSAKDGTLQSNKAAKALKEIAGIDVWDKKTGEVKDMFTVMDELEGKWGTLSEAEQNALGVTIAGKTQLNTFNALMSNWDTARQYVKEYEEGLMVGSAERENAQYLDSIAGKWNVIKENMKAAGNSIITSDMVKGFLDIGVYLSEGFNKGIQGITKSISLINKGELGKSISNSLYGTLEDLNLDNKFSNTLTDMIGNLSQGLFDNLKTGMFGKLLGGFGNNFKPIFDIFSKITDALSDDSFLGKIGNKISELKDLADYKLFGGEKELNKQIDGRNENINAIKSEINELKNQKQAIEDILPTYDELTKKTKLSASESQQLVDMKNQLAEINPDLVLGYDQNGTPILKNLDIQNKQLESQIKLKQQSQRLDENSLALDTLQRQTLGQKEFNKAYKEYNNMQLASDTKRKEGLFGKESMQDYAKRIIEDNKKIAEDNQKSYEQRLKDHQQYVQDEKAIQQKYMNEMTQKTSFNRMNDEMKSGMLSFMDALDWSHFSPAEGSQFAGMLANLGDKLVPTTEAMGKQSKAIAQLSQDYAEGKINLIDYTKGLTERYEAEKKFDAESFFTWRQDAQSYVDLTGDMIGASKAADVMAKSLSKITGIKASTWKTGLMFDPAPIDASNKALQKFLNSYGTGIQNMGKAKTDGLISQFETLQSSYTQMLDDISTQGTQAIDVEYLVNAKVNQPEPISELIDKIVSDNKVTESEIELLLNAQAEILNTGEISDETIKQIADEFNMTEPEVKAMLKIDAEVTGMEDLASKIEGWDELTNEEKELILTMTSEGEGEFKMSVEEWNQLTPEEKEEKLKLMAEGKEEIAEVKNNLEELPDEKNTNVNINASDTSGIDKGKEVEELPDNKRILVDASAGDTTGIEKGKEVEELPDDKNVIVNTPTGDITGLEKAKETETLPDNKNIMVNTPMGDVTGLTKGKEVETLPSDKSIVVNTPTGDTSGIEKGKEVETLPDNKQITVNASTGDTSGIEKAKEVDKLPKEKEIKVSIVQKAGNVLDSITNYFKSKAEQKVSVSVKVEGKDQVESLKNSISSLKGAGGNVTITATVNGKDQVESLKTSLSSMKNANVSVTITGNALSQANQIKSALMGIQAKNISINASGNALSQISSIKSALSGLQSKSISINASVGGAGAINALKAAIAGLKSRAVSVTASTSGTAQVNALTSAIARVKSKAVSVKANVTGTGAVNALTSAISRVKSKSVTISASVSGTGAVQGLASAIAGVHSKSVSVSVTKTVTTVERSAVASSTPISATPMLTNTPLADIPVSASDESSIDVPVSISANNAFGGTLDKNKILPSLDFDISHIKNLEEALKRIGKQIDFLNEKSEAMFGQEKINLLQQQIPLLREQQRIQEQIAKNERAQNNELVYWLSQQGFAFDNLGNISNYNDKLLAMEQNVESLKKKYDDLNDAKNKNETATKNAQKAYESANETLSKTKDYLEEYFTTNNQEIAEASKKWWEYENAIRDAEEAVRDLANAQLEFKIDSVSDAIDFLDAKIKNMNSQDKIKYLEEQNVLYREQQQLLHQLAEQMRSQLATLNPLSEEYAKLSSEIMKLSTKWWDLENSISDNLDSIFEEKSTNKLNNALENLENQIDFLDEKMNHYNGQAKIGYLNEQITLYKEQQNQMHLLAEELRYQLTLLDPTSEKYQELSSEIMSLSTEWWKVEEAIKDATSEIEELNRQTKLLPVEAELEELDVVFTRLQFELDLLDEKMEYAWDTKKIDSMKDSIGLLNKQLDLQQEKLGLTNSRFAIYQDSLRKYNFQFDKMGNVTNYSEVLNLYKNSSQLEEIIDLYKEYKDIQEELQDQTLDYWKMNNEVKELANEIEKLTREVKLFVGELDLTILNQQFDNLSNRLELINNELEYAYGVDKINLINESIELMNQQLVTQGDIISKVRQQMKIYQEDLGKYGFSFDNEGNILNYKEMMEYYQNTEDIEKLKDLTEEYFDLQSNELPDLIGKYSDLEKEIKDAYKDQLEITQDIEEEITKILKKEYERRKDEIEKYTDERIKLLEKEKKAYQDMRDEQDYEKSINEQTKEIADLQKKLETARKDNSIAGLKRQSEILKEIEEAQKKLEETTQDRIDKNYESNIDDEINKLEEEQEKLLASLDEKFSETNIAKMVAQAISSGFIEINGEVKTLQDALIQSVNDSAEGYSVMADIIKNELVSNLNVALNTMQQIADINEKLGLQNFNVISATQVAPTNIPTYTSGNSKAVTIGDTIINVSGSVDDITLGKIEDMIKEENERMLKEITNGI